MEAGRTLFKFPTEHSRFISKFRDFFLVLFRCLRFINILAWATFAGLDLQGEVDLTDTRYLCDKHFSKNYVSTQSRRKMLVHTAVPFKYKSDLDELAPPGFHIIGSVPEKRRKVREYSLNELSPQPAPAVHNSPPKILNRKRSSNRLSQNFLAAKHEQDEDSQSTEEQTEETFKLEPFSPAKQSISLPESPQQCHNELLIQPQPRKRVQYILVKSKPKPAECLPSVSRVLIRNSQVSVEQPVVREEEESFIEDANISSSSLDPIIEKFEPSTSKSSEPIESYSEFIFNGEKFVQMPKRIFEAELEKVRKEGEKSKQLLRKLKGYLNKIDLD